MFCRNCGKEVKGNQEFCEDCQKAMQEEKQQPVEPKDVMLCPFCGKETDKSERFCVHCDGLIQRQGEPKKIQLQEVIDVDYSQEKEKKSCLACRSVIPKSAVICPKCKKRADEAPPIYNSQTTYYGSAGSYGFGFLLTMFLGLIGLLIALSKNESETKRGAIHAVIAGIVVAIIAVIIVVIVVYASAETISYMPYKLL